MTDSEKSSLVRGLFKSLKFSQILMCQIFFFNFFYRNYTSNPIMILFFPYEINFNQL